jgi:hypothetical protein
MDVSVTRCLLRKLSFASISASIFAAGTRTRYSLVFAPATDADDDAAADDDDAPDAPAVSPLRRRGRADDDDDDDDDAGGECRVVVATAARPSRDASARIMLGARECVSGHGQE